MTEEEVYAIVSPTVARISDAFDVAVGKLSQFRDSSLSYERDGYLQSHLVRYFVRGELKNDGLVLVPQPNTGIEVLVPGAARIKVLRSSHSGLTPRAQSSRRRAYCVTSQVCVQPTLLPSDGTSAEDFWMPYTVSQESDGLAHLILDWELRRGEVVMHLSEPRGVIDGVMQLAWRRAVGTESVSAFVPTNEAISIFDDEEREVVARCSESAS